MALAILAVLIVLAMALIVGYEAQKATLKDLLSGQRDIITDYADKLSNRGSPSLSGSTLSMTESQCQRAFEWFYEEYPTYHYQDDRAHITLQFPILNPQEDAAQYCEFFFHQIKQN